MSENKALVSIAVATYNGEKYLREQIDSILNQTYPHIEVIVTDDGSSDNTISIIREYQEHYPSVHLFINERNMGVTKTFENSVRKCSGAYIAFSDQDDIWELRKIEIMLQALGKEDAIYCNSLLVDKDGISLGKDFKEVMNLRSYYSGAPFLLANCIPGHTLLMKASFVKTTLPFPQHIFFDRWISFCAASNNGVKYIDHPLVRYRQHETNTVGIKKMRRSGKRQTARELFDNKLKELKTFQTASISSEETKRILDQMTHLFTRHWSLARSIFFFKNIDNVLVIKNKPYYRKIFYCIKMFFKANY